MKLKVQHFFDASHQLPDTDNLITKACARLHGHTYKVIVEVEGENDKGGMIIDFKAIKQVIDTLDHRHINDIFKQENFIEEATAENIAKFLYNKIVNELSLNVLKIAICEGYKGENKASWVIYNNKKYEN